MSTEFVMALLSSDPKTTHCLRLEEEFDHEHA